MTLQLRKTARPYCGNAHKALSGNREAYMRQSADTRDGQVAAFRYSREQAQDHPSAEEVRAAYRFNTGAEPC